MPKPFSPPGTPLRYTPDRPFRTTRIRLELDLDYRHDDFWSAHFRIGEQSTAVRSASLQVAYLERRFDENHRIRAGRLEDPYFQKVHRILPTWIRANLFEDARQEMDI